MKRKHRLGQGISLLLVISLLLGVTVVGALAEDSGAGEVVAQAETTAPPSIGYTRITMADYKKADGTSIEAPINEEGKTYTSGLTGTYAGDNLDKTYLDIDINFNESYSMYFDYMASTDWMKDIRFTPYSSGFGVKHTGGINIGSTWISCGTSGFINLKLYTDIVENTKDATKNDVMLRVYVENELKETFTWTEDKGVEHNKFYFVCNSGSYTLRTPQPWKGYTRLTLENYNITASEDKEGTSYSTNLTGTYNGDGINKSYLDMDINFNESYSMYFDYMASTDWMKDIRFTPYSSGFGVKHTGGINIGSTWISCGTSGFVNLKLCTDIAENPEDTTKNDVMLRVYVENELKETLIWTEDKGVEHNKFYFVCNAGSFTLRTPLLPEDIDYRYDISTYRTTVNADGEYTSYPTKTGYVFGGWYSDVYLTEPLDFSVTTGKAYAKFVQEDVLTVKFQKLANASKTDTTTSLRAVTSVDSLDYEYVGFKRLVEGNTQEKVYKTKSVYRTIKGTVNGETYTYTPSNISDAAEYLMALSINKIPQSVYEKNITITPLWKTLDGTVVTGTARTIQLFPTDVEGGTTLYGGEDFENDNEAYYKNIWI